MPILSLTWRKVLFYTGFVAFYTIFVAKVVLTPICTNFVANLEFVANLGRHKYNVEQYGLSSVKKNELGDAGIEKKIVIVGGWTDSKYEVGSARNSRINSTIFPTPLALQHTVLTNQINYTYINDL